uniref:WAPL domain-containing protein n=1 Tax=Caenorhabditis tropicalis TaxID=1561998 RepID=A0A1I7T0A7_9PELO
MMTEKTKDIIDNRQSDEVETNFVSSTLVDEKQNEEAKDTSVQLEQSGVLTHNQLQDCTTTLVDDSVETTTSKRKSTKRKQSMPSKITEMYDLTLDISMNDSPVVRKRLKSSDVEERNQFDNIRSNCPDLSLLNVNQEVVKGDVISSTVPPQAPADGSDNPKIETISVLKFLQTIKSLVKFLDSDQFCEIELILHQKLQYFENDDKTVNVSVITMALETSIDLMRKESPKQCSTQFTSLSSVIVVLRTVIFILAPNGLDSFRTTLKRIKDSSPNEKIPNSRIEYSLKRAIDLVLS